MRTTIFGLLAGVLLSALRAPLGLDLTQVPAVETTTAALFRAVALAAIALVVNARRDAFRGGVAIGPLLVALTAGYAAHGLLVQPLWEPQSRLGFVLLLLALTGLMILAAGRRGPEPKAPPEEDEPGALGRLGVFVAGLGVALAFAHLARFTRLFGLGLPEEDTVLGAVVATGLAIGAVAFGAPLAHARRGRFGLAAGLSLGALATFLGLRLLGGLGQEELFQYLKRFDFDLTMIGMGRVMAVLGGASFVIAAFLVGLALAGARHASVLSTLVFGAAVGVLVDPLVVGATAEPLVGVDIVASTWAWIPFAIAVTVSGLGALLIAGTTRGGERVLALLAVGTALAGPWVLPRPAVWPFSPWFVTPIEPVLAYATPEGLLTVEAERAGLVVTLDRKRLTPTSEEEPIDAARLRAAWSLLPRKVREGGAARVLLVGQLTPARLDLLTSLGAKKVDRTAAWHGSMHAIEDLLFAGREAPRRRPLPPSEARRRIEEGSYDLIVVPSIRGPIEYPKSRVRLDWSAGAAPLVPRPDLPGKTVAVTWVDLDTAIVQRTWTERVVLALDRFAYASLGFVAGKVRGEVEAGRPALLPAGTAARRAPAWWRLETRSLRRGYRIQLENVERLAAAGTTGAEGELAAGLALHYRTQTHSSPFETLAQQIEFDRAEAEAFLRAALDREGATLDGTTRSVWEALAWLLMEKRFVEEILIFVEPVAERYAPWPSLDRAVLHAYEEFGEPAEAARIAARLVEAEPGSIDLLVEASRWSTLAGDSARAIEFARRAEAIQPGRRDLRRALGEALFRASDPEGRRILEQLFEEDPADLELLDLLTDGPPEPDLFLPGGDRHDH